MAGAPGAGKDFVADSLALGGQLGYKEINSDNEFERYMIDAGLTDEKGSIILDPNQEFERDVVRSVAKRHSNAKLRYAKIGRLGLLLNGTGASLSKMKQQKKTLEALGYECACVYVNVGLETAIQSDKDRGMTPGEREIGVELVTAKWKELNISIKVYKRIFGKLFFEVDNGVREKTPVIVRKLFGTISKWSKTMPKNKIAKLWMKNN
jgi:hypothetical protein